MSSRRFFSHFLPSRVADLVPSFQTFTTGYHTMVIGRIVSGFGVGFLRFIRLFLPTLPFSLALISSPPRRFQHDRARLSV